MWRTFCLYKPSLYSLDSVNFSLFRDTSCFFLLFQIVKKLLLTTIEVLCGDGYRSELYKKNISHNSEMFNSKLIYIKLLKR